MVGVLGRTLVTRNFFLLKGEAKALAVVEFARMMGFVGGLLMIIAVRNETRAYRLLK